MKALVFEFLAYILTVPLIHLLVPSGYFLPGEIVKRVSGKTPGEFARGNIFKPLGMKATHFYDDFTRIVKNRAIGYSPEFDFCRIAGKQILWIDFLNILSYNKFPGLSNDTWRMEVI